MFISGAWPGMAIALAFSFCASKTPGPSISTSSPGGSAPVRTAYSAPRSPNVWRNRPRSSFQVTSAETEPEGTFVWSTTLIMIVLALAAGVTGALGSLCTALRRDCSARSFSTASFTALRAALLISGHSVPALTTNSSSSVRANSGVLRRVLFPSATAREVTMRSVPRSAWRRRAP